MEKDTKNHLFRAVEKLGKQDEKIEALLKKLEPTSFKSKIKTFCFYLFLYLLFNIIFLESPERKIEVLSQKFEYLYSIKSQAAPEPFTFIITDFQAKLQSAKEKKVVSLWSVAFYSGNGYRAHLRIDLDGYGTGYWTGSKYISVYFYLTNGPFDEILDWPFRGIVTFSVQSNGYVNMNRAFDTTKLSQDLINGAFENPTTARKSGYGFQDFLSHDVLDAYVINNVLAITCSVQIY